MTQQVRLWRVQQDKALAEVPCVRLDREAELETWLEKDIDILDPGLLVIMRQQSTHAGGIDLLCIDSKGDLVIVELKRDKTPREVTAQALDYASWVVDLDAKSVQEIADAYLGRLSGTTLERAFLAKFDEALPKSRLIQSVVCVTVTRSVTVMPSCVW